MTNFIALIPSAGSGSRANMGENKLFCKLDDEPVITTTVKKFSNISQITKIVIIYKDGELNTLKELLKDIEKPIEYVVGGESRFDSVCNGLNVIDAKDYVLIHDGARPYISKEAILKCIDALKKWGTAILASKSVNTILDTNGDDEIFSSSRIDKLNAETPQCFKAEEIKKAYKLAIYNENKNFTDDAGVYCSYIGKCHAVLNNEQNKKITFKDDFNEKELYRCGVGFDLHILVENRKLILGGIEIPHTKGLLGHSDADVLTHAIMDALLSSVHLRDIGYYFSDKDPKYEGISSMILLDKVMKMVNAEGYKVSNISATVMAEKPKMSKYVPEIVENLAKAMNVNKEKIGIALTTLEGIGVVGREEGIACQVNAMVKRI